MNNSSAPLALYVHWPFCKAKCPYCDFNSHVRASVDEAAWEKALLAELKHWQARTPQRQLKSIFFGGGTPSLMPARTVQAIIEQAKNAWAHEAVEITLEANPTSVEASKFAAFQKAGINRVSLGIQSLRPEALKFLGREHSAEEAKGAIQIAADHFASYSFDLIYARPEQTLAQWQDELDEALQLAKGGHFSLYQLTIEQGTQFYHRHQKGEFVMPSEELSAQMFEHTQSALEVVGMPAYEISNHAKAGQECAHNLIYWQGDEYVGVGPGAHGRLCLSFSPVQSENKTIEEESSWQATVNLRSPEAWLKAVEEKGHGLESQTAITASEVIEEKILMGLRLREGLCKVRFARQTGRNLADCVPPENLARLIAQGFLENTPSHLRATPQGWPLLNALTEKLLVG